MKDLQECLCGKPCVLFSKCPSCHERLFFGPNYEAASLVGEECPSCAALNVDRQWACGVMEIVVAGETIKYCTITFVCRNCLKPTLLRIMSGTSCPLCGTEFRIHGPMRIED